MHKFSLETPMCDNTKKVYKFYINSSSIEIQTWLSIEYNDFKFSFVIDNETIHFKKHNLQFAKNSTHVVIKSNNYRYAIPAIGKKSDELLEFLYSA